MVPLFDLTDRSALVTGSVRGLGFALAEGLAAAGAAIIVNSRQQGAVDEAVARLRAKGYKVHGAVFDVTDEAAVEAAFEGFDRADMAIDILVNNAGIQFRKSMVDLDLKDWQRVIDTNFTSAFILGKETARRMIARGRGGKIINIQANAIGPGYFLTDMNAPLINNAEMNAWVKSSNPAGRWGQPDELAGTVVYLASSAPNYVNGQIVCVDGGWLAVL